MNVHPGILERPQPALAAEMKIVNLALQGGGAHGAFAWGVLDRLLEDERISFEGISATSAGAANAVVLAYGMAIGGREGARKALRTFWRAEVGNREWYDFLDDLGYGERWNPRGWHRRLRRNVFTSGLTRPAI